MGGRGGVELGIRKKILKKRLDWPMMEGVY